MDRGEKYGLKNIDDQELRIWR